MDTQEIIRRARELIGEGKDDDYVIAPIEHATALSENATVGLSAILESSRVKVEAKRYEEADGEAGEAQRDFKRRANEFNAGVLISVSLGVSVLLVANSVHEGDFLHPWLLLTLGVSVFFIAAFLKRTMFLLVQGRLFERWMGRRADAEERRIQFFEQVTKARPSTEGTTEVPLALLQLEYFRRYQLDVQRRYYRGRGVEHHKSARAFLRANGWMVFVSSVASGIGAFLATRYPAWGQLALLGVLGAAVSSYLSAGESIRQDQRNAERYRRTRDHLDDLSARLDDVRRVTSSGRHEPVALFVDAVHENLSAENRQWKTDGQHVSAALKRLNSSLEEVVSGIEKRERGRAD